MLDILHHLISHLARVREALTTRFPTSVVIETTLPILRFYAKWETKRREQFLKRRACHSPEIKKTSNPSEQYSTTLLRKRTCYGRPVEPVQETVKVGSRHKKHCHWCMLPQRQYYDYCILSQVYNVYVSTDTVINGIGSGLFREIWR